MIQRWLLALGIIAVCSLALGLLRRRSVLDPLVLFLGSTLLVGTFYPLSTSLVEPLTWRSVQHLPEQVLVAAEGQYLAFAVGAMLVVVLAWARGRLRNNDPGISNRAPTARQTWRDGVLAWGLFLSGLLLYSTYVSKVGLATLLDSNDFAEKYRVSTGLGTWLFGLNLIIVGCLWSEGSALRASHKMFFRIAALVAGLWAIAFLGVRTYAMALVIGYLYHFCRHRRLQLRSLRLDLVLVIALGYVGLEAYSLMRSRWDSGFIGAVHALRAADMQTSTVLGQAVGGSELAHPFITTMELVRNEEAGALAGESYLDAALILVPLAFAPDRPQSLAQSFVAEYYPDVDERGGGTAFSLVGEAWWNFGTLLGPFVIGLVIASILLWISQRCQRHPHGVVSRFTPYACYLALLLHRSTAANSLKQVLPLMTVIGLLCLVEGLAWAAAAGRADGRPRRTAPRPIASDLPG